jgi:hypothetical protein
MKKFSLFIGVCAAAVFVQADMPTITGTNVVGFAEIGLAAGTTNTIITVPFEACLGSGAGKLADLVATNGLTSAAADPAAADQLVVLTTNANEWVYYYYWLQSGQGWTAITTEKLMPGGTNATVNPPAATDFPIARGLGFWVKRASAGATTLYVKGQVSSAKQSTEIRTGLNLVGYGTVQAFTLNGSGIDWTGAYGGTGNTSTSDKILVMNGGGSFSEYFYFTKPSGWGDAYTALNGKWITKNYELATATITAGQGFWYLRRGTETFTFKPDGSN